MTLKTLITVLALTPLVSEAANVSLTASDAGGTSSLTSAGTWNNGAAPSAANDYFTSTFFARTPQAAPGSMTFAGNSLTLQTPSGQSGLPMRSIIYKGGANGVITINNLTNAGGVLNNGGSGNVLAIFTGNRMTVTADSLILSDQGPMIIDYPIVGSGNLTNNGQRTITYTNDNSGFMGRFVILNTVQFASPQSGPGVPTIPMTDQVILGAGSTLLDLSGITIPAAGGIALAGNATINSSTTNGAAMKVLGPISGTYNLIKRGSGILTLSGENTFSGGLSLYGITAGGQLNINSPTALGTGTFDISNGNNALIDNTSGSALTLANGNSQAWRSSFAFLGTSSLDMGSGTVTMYGNISVAVSNNTLAVGMIFDDGSSRSLTKTGPGTLAIGCPSYYFGNTMVSEGTLTLKDSASLYSPVISVASNAILNVSTVAGGLTLVSGQGSPQTLSGAGIVLGTVTDSGGSSILPGGVSAYGTLHIDGDLNLNGGGIMTFDLSADAASSNNDLVDVTGALNVNGPTALQIAGLPSVETYTLFRYGSFSGDVANFQVPPGYAVVNNTGAKTIELESVHVPTAITWVGDGWANVWDVGGNANWTGGAYFYNGDTATFDDSGSSSPSITLIGTVAPTATIVNASQNYAFTGSAISAGTLTKSGSGTLILENDNTYSGATVITGGTVQVGNAGTTGTLGSGAITNNASLVFNRSAALAVTNTIGGSGTLIQAGTGDITLTATNSYTGLTTVSSGRLFPSGFGALGTADAGTTVNGGQVYITATVDYPAEPWSLAGAAIRKGGSSVTTLGGPVSLLSDTTLDVDGGSTLIFTNTAVIDGSAANANLTLSGGGNGVGNIYASFALGSGFLANSGGVWTIAPANSYSGWTKLTGGRLRISDPSALGAVPASFTPNLITMEGGGLEAATNVVLSDGKRGITVSIAGTVTSSYLGADAGATFTIANTIAGDGSLVKVSPGTLVLSGANTFTGNFYLDSGSTSADDGATRITSAAAFGGVPAIAGTTTIFQGNNNSGRSTLQLDGTTGPITLAQEFTMNCRNNPTANIQNVAGNNTLSGRINLEVGGSFVNFQSDAGLLTLSGEQQFIGVLTGGRTYTFTGAGDVLVSGAILNSMNGAPISVAKNGTGTLTLSAANTYGNTTTVNEGMLLLTGSITSAGAVTVAGGTLAGDGIINALVTVGPAGTLSPGNGIGTLTINNNLVLGGTSYIELNKAAGTKDMVSVSGSIEYGGTLVVANLGGTLVMGDTFDVFDFAGQSGGFANIVNATGNSAIDFAFDPATGVITVVEATTPPTITFGINGNTLSLSWPSTGWYVQSNSVDIVNSAEWHDVPGSQNSTSLDITTDPAQPKVFFRLRK